MLLHVGLTSTRYINGAKNQSHSIAEQNYRMVKEHNVLVEIKNKSGIPMTLGGTWYDSGRTADGFSWPQTIDDSNPAILS